MSAPHPKILIVDDHPANLRAFSATLESLPVSIDTASSGSEALALLLKEEYAVILLDVRMPVMDGLETAMLIRKRGRAQFTPIIFISAYEKTPLEVAEGYLAGAIDYLFSPVDPETLKRKVAAFVELYRKNAEAKIAMEDLIRFNALQEERIHRLEEANRKLRAELERLGEAPPVVKPASK